MDYERTLTMSDTRQFLCVLRTLLIAEGFSGAAENRDGFTMSRRRKSVNNHDVFSPVSVVQATSIGGQIRFRAEYGNLRWSRNFLLILLGSLAIIILSIGTAAQSQQSGLTTRLFNFVKPSMVLWPWVVIGPLMFRGFRRQSVRALDRLWERTQNTMSAADSLSDENLGSMPSSGKPVRPPCADYERIIGGTTNPAGLIRTVRALVPAADFRFGACANGGFCARKPWIGVKGGDILPFVAAVEAVPYGQQVRIRAEISRASIRLVSFGLLAVLFVGITCLFYFTRHAGAEARRWIFIGIGLSAPELILLLFLPIFLRRWAFTKIEALIRHASDLATALNKN